MIVRRDKDANTALDAEADGELLRDTPSRRGRSASAACVALWRARQLTVGRWLIAVGAAVALCVFAALIRCDIWPNGDGSGQALSAPEPRLIDITIDATHGMRMIGIAPGTFVMGSSYYTPEDAEIRGFFDFLADRVANEGPRRRTTITRAFYIAETKTTVDLFCYFLNDVPAAPYVPNPGWAAIEIVDGRYVPKPDCGNIAVGDVDWASAAMFCEWLSMKTGHVFRLPTEAEWAFAARGTEGRIHPWGNVLDLRKEYGILDPHRTDPARYPNHWNGLAVGAFPDNATPEGVLDMVGSPGEWCADYYAHSYDRRQTVDPQGPASGTVRVLRGRFYGASKRNAADPPAMGGGVYGVRVVMEVTPGNGGVGEEGVDDES